ncbi:uncharacterized protein N0V89_007274 [Didymosphaeria variabile]|uniref:Alpha/beta-hydrolase n=1 Tax=Didymosphaeria variabile TaxID=1932322 RepID=A0A9W8XIJ5_9PLEO|nr:uncharacterized protein N0V89_007274 [Didymosphaeria variabile]KAJ4351930.1 hypothetical protein N0V89_007274 [Didymosphaeria variabile]
MNLWHFLVGFLAQVSQSQFTSKVSQAIPGAIISYKETIACSSTSTVVSYSGYVRWNSIVVPGAAYNTSTFFWFFPARNPAGANLALYLAGGPGEASSFAALTENGPCVAQKDGNTAIPNPFSFNQNAHVLYVDQPNQVGFSYDEIVDGVFNVFGGQAGSGAIEVGATRSNMTNIKGKFPSQNPDTTARTSTMAAKSMCFGYGGMYVATLATYILRTNLKLPVKAGATFKDIFIPSVGITNGCIDIEAQGSAYASLPYNNTYNNANGTPFRLYSKAQYDAIVRTSKGPGGCFDQVQECRKLRAANDPRDEGKDEATNTACVTAAGICNKSLLGPFFSTAVARSQFDIGLNPANPNPPTYAASFLNKPSTRDSLGVPAGLNYTLYSSTVFNNFYGGTGDPMRKGSDDLMYLLNQDTRVAMIYGDRDWRCNWLGAENLTLSLPWSPYPSSTGRFTSSGYVPFQLPSSTRPTAVTRQHTLLSFTRVFDAGHAVSWYQPATVQAIFNRVIRDLDVATGIDPGSRTITKGKPDSWSWRSVLPAPPSTVECSLWNVASSCTQAQVGALEAGTAKVDGGWRVVWPVK